jgi:branched-chain amino acid transport system substrate-binding protein
MPTVSDSTTFVDPQGLDAGGGRPEHADIAAHDAGTTTGVTDSTITIGIHAPLTGAAPLRAESFEIGKDLYWEKGNNGEPVIIYGRRVKVVFQDDQYNPSHARAVCQELVEAEHAFLLIGGAGTDQIQACAQYAAHDAIPYLSNGVTEIGLSQLDNYFAVSMSYPDQAPLLADYMRSHQNELGWGGDPAKVVMIATNSPNLDDAVLAFTSAMPGAKVIRPEKGDRGASMAGILCTGTVKNYEVVFPMSGGAFFLEMIGASKCNPQYVGVGVGFGIDEIARVGCSTGGLEGSRFFSPAPAFADSDRYDPAFRRAAGPRADDIMFLFWGISKTLHQLLLQAGPNLTREGFITSTESATVHSDSYPDLRFSPADHFGAQQVNVLRAVCENVSGHFITETAFRSAF